MAKELPKEVRIDVQDHVEATAELQQDVQNHVQAARNRKQSRIQLLQWGFTMMAVNGALICDFSVKPLTELYIFAVYCGLFMGLLLLLAAERLPQVPISATVVKNMVRTTVVLLHVELGLKVAILLLSKKLSGGV